MTRLDNGLIFAWRLDGAGGGRRLAAEALMSLAEIEAPVWAHLNRDMPDSAAWLRERTTIPRDVRSALLLEDTRPRCEALHDGLLLNLRGVNLHPDADPDDLLSVRIWVQPGLAVTLRRFHVMAAEDISNQLAGGTGPKDLGALLALLATRLTERLIPKVDALEAEIDAVENRISSPGVDVRELPGLRRRAVTLRRFVAPQQTALSRLSSLPSALLSEDDRIEIRHTLDTVTRLTEDLDALWQRTSIVDDQIRQRQAEHMGRATYLLSLVATLFLPLGFLTGLLGINVGGIPGADTSWAFWLVCGLLFALGLAGWTILRRYDLHLRQD